MTTKEKILAQALKMFNEEGLKETTLRKIAQALGMSQGNLNYHFKTKDELVSALYFELVELMNVQMLQTLNDQPILSYLYESSLVSMTCMYRYKFIIKDLYHVLKTSEQLNQHYLELQHLRSTQFLQLFDALIAQGLMRPATFENEYQRFYERLNILGDNWIHMEDIKIGQREDFIAHYHSLLFEVIYPYLTETGKLEYQRILERKQI